MNCAIGGEADIPATQRFFVQGQHERAIVTSKPPGGASCLN
jgi:hypothetical protein